MLEGRRADEEIEGFAQLEGVGVHPVELARRIREILAELFDPVGSQRELNEACDAQNLLTETLLCNKGDTVIWHPLLPHGGAPLRDPTLSQFSIVFHTAPERVPVLRGNAFFDQAAKPPPNFSHRYRELDQRLFADYARATAYPKNRGS